MMTDTVLKTIQKYSMLERGDSVLIGVSGGADSMALVSVMLELKEQLGLSEICVCHFNHGLRGIDSDKDERYVLDYCRSRNIRIMSENGNMTEREKPRGESIESWARKLRYEFFERCITDKSTKVALAHSKNDCVETAVFNLIRGSGIKGLRGVAAIRGHYIRPLIETSRAEIESYCDQCEIDYRTDSTNEDTKYSRNRIRKKILPQMAMINENAVNNIFRFCKSANEINSYFERAAESLIEASRCADGYLVDKLRTADPLIVSFALKQISEPYTINITSEAVELCLCVVNGTLKETELAKHVYFTNRGDTVAITKRENAKAEKRHDFIAVHEGINKLGTDISVVAQFKIYSNCTQNEKLTNKLLNNSADCVKLKGNLTLRTRRDGDSFCSFARKNTKSLKKLFNEAKIAPSMRDSIPVICDDEGIVWIRGFGISSRVSLDINTEKIITFG
ncbi:MAG: tRNA lysidine(34) synthetase TilS [Oscillospiraceae bacterium]